MRTELSMSDDRRHELLAAVPLPVVCRLCEDDLRMPGQYLCESCAADKWGRRTLSRVIEQTEDLYE